MARVKDNRIRIAYRKARGNTQAIAELVGVTPTTVRARIKRMPVTVQEVDRLWVLYDRKKSIEVRNELASRYYTAAMDFARGVLSRLHVRVDLDDVRSHVHLALLDCVERYDVDRGRPFMPFASRRIAGAVQDALREMDWATRHQRLAINELERVTESLTADKCGPVSAEELEAAVDEGTIARAGVRAPVDSLDRVVIDGRRQCRLGDVVPAPAEHEPEGFFDDMTRGLGVREATVLYLYYRHKVAMKSIGDLLNLSESRISQMLAQTRRRLAERGKSRAVKALRSNRPR